MKQFALGPEFSYADCLMIRALGVYVEYALDRHKAEKKSNTILICDQYFLG